MDQANDARSTTSKFGALPLPEVECDGVAERLQRTRTLEALFETSPEVVTLGRYEILNKLGEGGMGTVLEAFDPELDRHVALKVLREQIGKPDTARLRREAQALAKLSHPNVVQVHEVGEVDGQTYVAMELVQGQALDQWIRQDPRPSWRACVEVFLQVGAGLAAAHAQGLVHRDFKPGNAIVDDEGRARVLDFGLARRVDDSGVSSVVQSRSREHTDASALDAPLTKTGDTFGTPAYMPPEQRSGGREADARSDQFSFCVSLWEAVYGERPFEDPPMTGLIHSMESGRVRPEPKGSRVPTRLRAVLLRGLALRPEQRWPSMEALLEQLRRLVAPRTRRGIMVVMTLGLAGLGTALAVPQVLALKDRCTGARAQLRGIWDDARRQQVKGAVLGTGLSYAEGTWARIEPQLDDYADAWVGTHTAVCEATSVRHEQTEDAMTLRMGCLHERRTALNAAVNVLADADAKAVENAVKLVAGLPDLARCDDVERLQEQRQRVPPPEDPQVAQEVDVLREELAAIAAMRKAGQYDDALKQAERVVQQAEALGYSPLRAEAEYWWGELLESNGRYAEAEPVLTQAHARATRLGHDAVVLDATQALAYVVGYQLSRHAEGLVWGKTAVSLAERSGDEVEVAASLGTLGSVLYSKGEYEQAKVHYQRALQIEEKALGPDDPHVAASLGNLGSVFGSQGEYEQAKVHFQRALQIEEKALGPDHPDVAGSLDNLGNVVFRQGEYEQAKLHYQRALRLDKKALGADHPDVAISLGNLGNVFQDLGEHEQAKRHHQQALQIREKALGADHPDVAMSLDDLGNVFHRQGEYEQAKLHHQRALRIREDTLGADHPEMAASLNNLGNVSLSQGEYEQAKVHYQRALKIFENALGGDHPIVADILGNLGNVFASQGEYEQAKLHYQRALRIREKALGSDHPDVAYSLVGLAEVALAEHDAATTRGHAERAVSIREAATVAPELLASARFVLARALWSYRAQRGRARTLAEQAREAFAEHGKGREDDLDEVEAWLKKHRVK